MKYKIHRDIEQIRLELSRIGSLKQTVDTVGWKYIVETFHHNINRLMQDVFDKCGDPKKHELEIKCKKMLADALGDILYQIDTRIKSEWHLNQQLNDKSAKLADIADRQRLSQM